MLLKHSEKRGNKDKQEVAKIELWPNIDLEQYDDNNENNIGIFAVNNFFGSCFKSADIPDPRYNPVPLGLMELG